MTIDFEMKSVCIQFVFTFLIRIDIFMKKEELPETKLSLLDSFELQSSI